MLVVDPVARAQSKGAGGRSLTYTAVVAGRPKLIDEKD